MFSQDCPSRMAEHEPSFPVLQTRPEKKHLAQFGLDLIKGEVRNNVQAGVLEPVLAKTKIIQVQMSSTCLISINICDASCRSITNTVHIPAQKVV